MDKKRRFEIIHELKSEYPIQTLVQVANVSRAGYYKWLHGHEKRALKQEQNAALKGHILAIHQQYPFYGYKRIRVALKREGIVVNAKKVRRLMRELKIRSLIRKKRPFYGRKTSMIFPNLLEQKFIATKPMQKLATDITYIRVNEDFVYLSAVIDLYNNEVVAWAVSERNDMALVQATLKKLSKVQEIAGAILHSDQGFQYTTKTYANQLADLKLTGSHSRRGNCFDNACIESFFSHFKTEEIYLNEPDTYDTAKRNIERYIRYYNSSRFQAKLGERSPIEYREALAA